MARLIRARFYKHGIQSHGALSVRLLTQLRIKFGKIEPIFASADFVKHFAETENVRARSARTFGWNVAFRSDEGALSANGDQTDVREFWHTINKNNVGRFDIAMS